MINENERVDHQDFRPRISNLARAEKVARFFGFLSNMVRGDFKSDKIRKNKTLSPQPILLFNSMCTAKETTQHHGIWGNDGVVSNTMRHSWKIIAILVELVNKRLRPGEDALPMPHIFDVLGGNRAAEHGGVLGSAEVAENCGALAAGQGVLSAEADDGHKLAAEGGIDLAHDMVIHQDIRVSLDRSAQHSSAANDDKQVLSSSSDDEEQALCYVAPREIDFASESEAGTEGSGEIEGSEHHSRRESPEEPSASAPTEQLPQSLRVSPTVKRQTSRLEQDIKYIKRFQVFLYYAVHRSYVSESSLFAGH
jgi:hypothetical protein